MAGEPGLEALAAERRGAVAGELGLETLAAERRGDVAGEWGLETLAAERRGVPTSSLGSALAEKRRPAEAGSPVTGSGSTGAGGGTGVEGASRLVGSAGLVGDSGESLSRGKPLVPAMTVSSSSGEPKALDARAGELPCGPAGTSSGSGPSARRGPEDPWSVT